MGRLLRRRPHPQRSLRYSGHLGRRRPTGRLYNWQDLHRAERRSNLSPRLSGPCPGPSAPPGFAQGRAAGSPGVSPEPERPFLVSQVVGRSLQHGQDIPVGRNGVSQLPGGLRQNLSPAPPSAFPSPPGPDPLSQPLPRVRASLRPATREHRRMSHPVNQLRESRSTLRQRLYVLRRNPEMLRRRQSLLQGSLDELRHRADILRQRAGTLRQRIGKCNESPGRCDKREGPDAEGFQVATNRFQPATLERARVTRETSRATWARARVTKAQQVATRAFHFVAGEGYAGDVCRSPESSVLYGPL